MSTQTNNKNNPCSVCGRYNNRPVSIDAVIVKDDFVLLIKRGMDPCKGLWALPGGHVDWDETVEDAVRREVQEEVGLRVTKLTMLGVYSDPGRHPKQAVAVSYICTAIGEPKAGDDAADVEYFSLDRLPSPLAFDHTRIIADYRKLTS